MKIAAMTCLSIAAMSVFFACAPGGTIDATPTDALPVAPGDTPADGTGGNSTASGTSTPDGSRGGGPTSAATTFVALTFDDTLANQSIARDALDAAGIKGTFFVNSVRIGSVSTAQSAYFSLQDVLAMQSEGHEIGGHTKHHFDLRTVHPDEVARQVCDDRARLLALGVRAQSFAYPLGMVNDSVKAVVRSCGYGSARVTNHGTPWPAPLVPTDLFAIPAAPSAEASMTLADLEKLVTTVEDAGGGFVPMTFHNICEGCSSNAVTPDNFRAFVTWLAARTSRGTVTRTMREMIGGDVAPAPDAAPLAPLRAEPIANPSLEAHTFDPLTPDCFMLGVNGIPPKAWSVVSDAHSGATAMHLGVPTAASSDRRINARQDMGECATPVASGELHQVSAWYKSGVNFRIEVYTRNDDDFWDSWKSSPDFPPSATWTQAVWTLPAIPDGIHALGVGAHLDDEGSMTVDDFMLSTVN